MKKNKTVLYMTLALLLMAIPIENVARNFRIITFNIRLLNNNDGDNHWDNRKKDDVDFLKKAKPDVFGLQEATWPQLHYIDSLLTDYDYVGVGRDDGKKSGEFSPVFYNKKRYKLVKSGTFWLSETPDEPSFGWKAACRRVCSWAILQDIKNGNNFIYANTHLDHVSKDARSNGALLIKETLSKLANNIPMMITGDFNVTDKDEAYSTMRTRIFPLNDARKAAQKNKGLSYSFHNWGKIGADKGSVIDFIFLTPTLKVKKATIFDGSLGNGRFLSDHHPVIADIDGALL